MPQPDSLKQAFCLRAGLDFQLATQDISARFVLLESKRDLALIGIVLHERSMRDFLERIDLQEPLRGRQRLIGQARLDLVREELAACIDCKLMQSRPFAKQKVTEFCSQTFVLHKVTWPEMPT
jgi:hypothetical protein